MGKRQMPKAGFYVRPPCIGTDIHGTPWRNEGGITYTTGIRGGGGHKYVRFDLGGPNIVSGDVNDWPSLLWSCVPGKKELPNLIYAKTLEEAVFIYNSGLTLRYLDYGKYAMENLEPNPKPIKII